MKIRIYTFRTVAREKMKIPLVSAFVITRSTEIVMRVYTGRRVNYVNWRCRDVSHSILFH